ncbi:NAD(P)-binding domain-containing protein [Streptomyces bathyalis]|uniref:NAD(P)-binding domain-containing protein n=1 Tax=Streptomyces bathyalis TaxID=2710756 RepID=A0A7T1WSP6_9ACTN|nr:NAD/NADP-dependent octopine/nopaline dehydrogenase family protein [Streptomyces bathyalis]QPP07809.1 NAD(P)-binding domain-containing protein [Streptomyces bathyalis]
MSPERRSGETGVLGAGSEGLALAAHLASRGEPVHLHTRHPGRIRAIGRSREIRARGLLQGRFPLAAVSSDLEEVAERCGVLFVATVTTAYRSVAAALAPHLRSGHVVVLFSGKLCGSAEFGHALAGCGAAPVDVVETDALFAARAWEDEGVVIHGEKKWNLFTGLDRAATERHEERLRGLFPGLERASCQVQRGLTDFGAVAHATIALANISRIDRAEELLFYREGLSERTVVLMEQVEREFQRVGEAYEAPVPSMVELLDRYYGCEGETLLEAMRSVRVYRDITAPRSLDHRFLREDVASTLVPLTQLAERAAVPTPMTDALVSLFSALGGEDYRRTGRTLARLGWDGLTYDGIRRKLSR